MLQSIIEYPAYFALYFFVLIFAITLHEFAHAKAADFLGDPTPRLQKRLTLNPLSHLDPFGILFLFVVGFGWGKPVMFDPFNLKNPKRDGMMISVAGPLTNFAVAAIASVLYNFFDAAGFIIYPFIRLNIMLGIFNLIPIHPLDGFKVVSGLLSGKKLQIWNGLEKYGPIFLIILVLPLGKLSIIDTIISPIVSFVIEALV